MKTWEMIKALSENQKLEFESEDYIASKIGCLLDLHFKPRNCKSSGPSGNLRLVDSDDWQLVREPVDFMTAMKAFNEGRTVRCECPGITKRIYEPSPNDLVCDQIKDPVSSNEILNGKWYIED